MKQTKLALSAVMIVAIGLIGTNFVTGSEMTGLEKFGAISNSNTVYGHLTIIHSDLDGNILSYVQTDNLVAKNGKDCLSNQIFGNTDTECTSAGTTSFNTIALFNAQTFPITMNATGFDGGVIGAGTDGLLETELTNSGLVVSVADSVTNNANATSGGTGTKTDIKKTFTAGAAVSQVVNGAGLFNDAEDAVLAAQVFTSVTLNESDTLAITWTITIG